MKFTNQVQPQKKLILFWFLFDELVLDDAGSTDEMKKRLGEYRKDSRPS